MSGNHNLNGFWFVYPLRLTMTSAFSHLSYISFAQELHRNTITPESVSENPPVRVNGVKNGEGAQGERVRQQRTSDLTGRNPSNQGHWETQQSWCRHQSG